MPGSRSEPKRPLSRHLLRAQACTLVLVIRLRLKLDGSRLLRSALGPQPTTAGLDATRLAAGRSCLRTVAEVVRAVGYAAHRIPGSTCLVQALAGQAMLRHRGIAARLCLGVAHLDARRLGAHAWLECGGTNVLGDSGDLDRFASLVN